jgi:ubiquinone/menaquinone biosynthesis C-methylase UbiE
VSGTTERAARTTSALRCPRCGGELAAGPDLRCRGCGQAYEEPLAGIPDLRLSYPDPQLSRDEDARIARELAGHASDDDFAALLDRHWRLVGKQPELAARFTAQELAAAGKTEPIVEAIETARGRPIGAADTVLEVGCGTAALAAATAARGASVVATDLSLRWLVLAGKRLASDSTGSTGAVDLVACAAEAMPFPDDSFDLVAAADVVEHVESPERFARECARVLRPGGLAFLATPNRYTLGLEPHVRLWGVGYLPRGAAERYVQKARGVSYDHVHLLSARTLRRLLDEAGFETTIVAPEIPDASQRMYSGMELRLVRGYNRARGIAPVHAALLAVGPFFHVFARKPKPA